MEQKITGSGMYDANNLSMCFGKPSCAQAATFRRPWGIWRGTSSKCGPRGCMCERHSYGNGVECQLAYDTLGGTAEFAFDLGFGPAQHSRRHKFIALSDAEIAARPRPKAQDTIRPSAAFLFLIVVGAKLSRRFITFRTYCTCPLQ